MTEPVPITLAQRGDQLLKSIGSISDAWYQTGIWVEQTARNLQILIGDKPVEFVTGYPWTERKPDNDPGGIFVFTPGLIFDATIATIPGREGMVPYPFTSVTVKRRSQIKSITLPNDQPLGDDYPDARWPAGASVIAEYDDMTLRLPLPERQQDNSTPRSQQLETFYRFLPSLLDDLSS